MEGESPIPDGLEPTFMSYQRRVLPNGVVVLAHPSADLRLEYDGRQVRRFLNGRPTATLNVSPRDWPVWEAEYMGIDDAFAHRVAAHLYEMMSARRQQ